MANTRAEIDKEMTRINGRIEEVRIEIRAAKKAFSDAKQAMDSKAITDAIAEQDRVYALSASLKSDRQALIVELSQLEERERQGVTDPTPAPEQLQNDSGTTPEQPQTQP